MVGVILITKASIFFPTSLTEVSDRPMDHLRVATKLLFQNEGTCNTIQYNTCLFMMFNNIQKCIKRQEREDKKIKIKYIMKRKHEVYSLTFPK